MDVTEPDPILLAPDDADSLYANTANVWWTPHDVVIDLHTLGPVDPDEGVRIAVGIARVRLPRTMIMGVLTRLSQSLGPLDTTEGRDAP